MNAAEIVGVLEQKFGSRIQSKKLDAIDPFIPGPTSVIA